MTSKKRVCGRIVAVNLQTGEATGGDAEGDHLVSIEGLHGSSYNDILVGDEGSNLIYSGLGSDFIDGGAGDDKIIDESKLSAGSITGTTTIHGGLGNDELWGRVSKPSVLFGDDGDDVIWYGTEVHGGAGNDWIGATVNGSQVFGEDGNDYIRDSYGSSTISGGEGNDYVLFDGIHNHSTDKDEFHLDAGDDVAYIRTQSFSGILSTVDGGDGLDTLVLDLGVLGYWSESIDFRP